MLHKAAKAGATHVKLQHIYAKNLTFRPEFESGGNDEISGSKFVHRPYKAEYDRLAGLELPESVCSEFIKECNNLNVIPLTTCFCTEHVDIIYEMGFREVKVASYDCASGFLLETLKNRGFDHIYVSTGATFDSEIVRCRNILRENFTFLHCVTRYPTPIDGLNLNRIKWLSQYTDEVGYSDHSETKSAGIFPIIAAIFHGANVIEAHFTILDKDQTKDGPISIGAKEIQEIKEFFKLTKQDQMTKLEEFKFNEEEILGPNIFKMSHEEYSNRLYYRGRFASLIEENGILRHIYNWEPIN